MLMEPIISDLPFKKGDDVLLFVNGMGGTPLIELYIVYRKAAQIAKQHGLKIVRNLVGPYITSLEMAGTSITLLKMNDQLCKLWDAPVDTPGFAGAETTWLPWNILTWTMRGRGSKRPRFLFPKMLAC